MQHKLPLVSIVTPSYNQGRFIEETILSIKNQTYPLIEHIIVDGGSTDNTLDIIKKYEHTYNMQWVSEPDNGMYEAINKGLGKAQGEILAYLNTDDLYLPWTVSVAVEYLNQHPEIQLVYGDLININIETQRNTLWFFPKYSLSSLINRGVIAQPTVFFRKSVMDAIGIFDEGLKFVGDCDYWMRAGETFKFSKIEEFLAISRDHRMTLRERNRQQLLEELEYVRQRHGAPPRRQKKRFTRIVNFFEDIWLVRYMLMKFLLYYRMKPKKSATNNFLVYPWQRLIEFPGFRVVSWTNLFMIMTPLLNRKCEGNWFILDMEKEVNEGSTNDKQHV